MITNSQGLQFTAVRPSSPGTRVGSELRSECPWTPMNAPHSSSQSAVDKAIDILRGEGLLRTVTGCGIYVVLKRPRRVLPSQ